MNWIYKNETDNTVLYRNYCWGQGEIVTTSCPVPDSFGLTCLQEGSLPDPVLYHDDLVLPSGFSAVAEIDAPYLSHNVALDINCMTRDNGVECRFNSSNNKPIPIDVRGFSQVIDWTLCSKLFLHNPTDSQVIISITAIEVVC